MALSLPFDLYIPFFESFHEWLLEKSEKEQILGSSKTSEAIKYTLSRWNKLIKFLDYSFVTPDTNAAERAVKPFVMARKNFLFSGSGIGAKSTCFIFTLIETAKANGLNPQDYLRCLFERIDGYVYSKLDKFQNKKEESEFYEQLNNDELAKIYSLEKTVYRQVERKYFKEQKVCESLYEGDVVKYFTEELRILVEDNELNYRTFHNAAYKSDKFYLETYFEK